MLVDEIADPDTVTPADVRAEYETTLAAIVENRGADCVAEETGIDQELLESLVAGGQPDLTMTAVADLLALGGDYPDAETVLLEVRDSVMLGMSTAVMDVDAMEAGLPLDLDARDIQQKIEGRQPMTLAEYAHIAHHIASKNPY